MSSDWPSGLERRFAETLRELLSRGSWLSGWKIAPVSTPRSRTWDILASGPLPGRRTGLLCVECKTENFQPCQFVAIANRTCTAERRTIARRVLAMPRISARMAELCEQYEWGWFDLTGNCRVEIPGVFLVERSGSLSAIAVGRHRQNRITRRVNLGTRESARVIRALLAPENAGRRWRQRELLSEYGNTPLNIPPPSLGLVNKVIRYLTTQAVITQEGKSGFQVSDYEGVLRLWREHYRFDCHVRKPYFTLLKDRELHTRLLSLDPTGQGKLAYASFSAADWQVPTVRQPRTWVYLDINAEDDFRATAEAKPVDSGENIVVLIPEDRGVFYRLEKSERHAACTNALQTYIDLIHSGGRGQEAADAILDHRLKPAWSASLP